MACTFNLAFLDWLKGKQKSPGLIKEEITKILNSRGNAQKFKVDRTDKIEKSIERLTGCLHTPDLVQTFQKKMVG